MRVRPTLALAGVAALCGGLLPLAAPADAAPQHRSRWIVRYASEDAAGSQRVQAASQGSERRLHHVFPGALASLTPAQADRLRATPGVVSVVPDQRVHAAGVEVPAPIGLDRIDQRTSRPSQSYTSHYTGAGVKAYVIDSGINPGSKDFTGRIAAGHDFVDSDATPTDCAGHGTHVAGILAGTTYGVAKRATIVPLRVLDCDAGGYAGDVVSALDWAIGDHAAGTPAVANISITGAASDAIDQAVTRAVADGITVSVAAGNDAKDACQASPARVGVALTVANASVDDYQAATSNTGRCVDLYAPGEGITSDGLKGPSSTAVMSGTSMASPHVAGAAALVLQARPGWSPAQVSEQLVHDATPGVILRATAGTPNRMLYTLGGVTPGELERTGHPAIVGTAQVGRVLTASTGLWGDGRVSLSMAWYRVHPRSGQRTAIPGATAARHVVTAADRGYELQFQVTASKPDYLTRTVTASVTRTVP